MCPLIIGALAPSVARREDIMDGQVCANRVKIDELCTKVTLGILDTLVEY